MKLEQIKLFLGLAKELHFWRASEKMFITQSALSRQISALESDLGIRLFERNRRSVKLTPAGEFLRDEWQRLTEEINSIHQQAKKISLGEVGAIRIGHPGSITYSFLPDLLASITKRYPKLEVELIETVTSDLEDFLLNYKVNIGFKREPAESKQLNSKLLFRENFALAFADKHWLRSKGFKGLKALKNEKFILPSIKGKTKYAETLRNIFRDNSFTPEIYLESDFGATILSLVSKNLGVSIMPVSYSRHSPRGVRFIELPYQTSLYALWRKSDDDPVLDNILAISEEIV